MTLGILQLKRRVFVLGALAALLSGGAKAQTSNWYGPYGSNVGTGNAYSWSENTVPAGGTAAALNWNVFDQLSYSVNNTITGLSANSLNFNSPAPGGGSLTISGNSIFLDGNAGGSAAVANNTGGNVTISAGLAFAPANTGLSLLFNGTGTGTTTVSGVISGSSTNNIVVNTVSSATTNITGNNTGFLGSVSLVQGILGIGNVNALGGAATNIVTIAGSNAVLATTLNYTGSYASPSLPPTFPTTINNNIVIGPGNQLKLTASGTTSITDTTPTIPTTTVTQTVTRLAGLVSGVGGVTLLGGPVEFINPTNSFSGQVTVQGGSLRVSASVPASGSGVLGTPGAGNEPILLGRSFGSGGSGTTAVAGNLFNGAELAIGSTSASSFGRPITADAGPLRVGISNLAGSAMSFSGAVAVNNRLTLLVNGSNSQTLTGLVSGSGSLDFTAGTTILGIATGNTYTGGTYISGGFAATSSTTGFGTGTINYTIRGGGISGLGGAISNAINLGGMNFRVDGATTSSIFSFEISGITLGGSVFGTSPVSLPAGGNAFLANPSSTMGILTGGSALSSLFTGIGTLNLFSTPLSGLSAAPTFNFAGAVRGSTDTSTLNKYGGGVTQGFTNEVEVTGTINNFGGGIAFSGTNGIMLGTLGYTGGISGVNTPSAVTATTLQLDYSAASAAAVDRLPAGLAVTLNAGSMQVTGNATSPVVEATGNLTLSGFGSATLVPNGQDVTLQFASLTRAPNQGGTILVRGGAPFVSNLGVNSQFIISGLPLTGGGSNTNDETLILPYIIAETTGTTLPGNTFATRSASGSISPVPISSYSTYTAAGPNSNARAFAAESGLVGKTIQSLVLDSSNSPGYSFQGTGVLKIQPAGSAPISAVLVSGSNAVGINGFTSLDFGGLESIFYVTGATNIVSVNVPVTGVNATAGFVKSGSGMLFLNTPNSFTARIVAAGGTLNVTNNSQLGDPANQVLLNGGSLMWNANTGSLVQPLPRTLVMGPAGGALNVVTGNPLSVTGLSGTGPFIKGGAGTLTITGTNTNTGRTVIAAGVLEMASDAPLSTSPFISFEGAFGATLRITASTFNKDLAVLGQGIIDIPTAADTTTYTGRIFGGNNSSFANTTQVNQNIGLTKIGAGSLVFNSSQPLGGPLAVLQGNVTLNAAGALPSSFGTPLMAVVDAFGNGGSPNSGSHGAYIAFGSSVTLDNAGTNNNDRWMDYQSVRLHNGSLNLVGNSAVDSYETMNALLLQAGSYNTVTLTPGTGRHASFGFTTLTPVTGQSTGGIGSAGAVLFRGTNLGQAPTAGATTSGVVFTDASSSDYSRPSQFLVGGGGAPGTTSVSILPFAIGDPSATGTGTGFVTLDGATAGNTGIRLLSGSEYAGSIASAAGSVTLSSNNVRLISGATVNGPTRINSLVLASGSAGTSGSGALSLNSGAVLSTGGFANAGLNNSFLLFGSTPAYFFVNDNLTVSSSILGHNPSTPNAFSLLKAGTGTLNLTGANSFGQSNSGVSVASGTLRVSDANALNPVSPVTVLNGAVLDVNTPVLNIGNLVASVPATFLLNPLGGGSVLLNSNTLNIGLTNTSAIFAGVISGTGNLARPTAAQASTATLIGNNTYTGSTTIVNGTISLQGSSGALSATSGVNVAGGSFTISNFDSNGFSGLLNDTRVPATADFRLAGSLTFTGNTNANSRQSFALASGFVFQGGSVVSVNAGTWANSTITLGLGAGGAISRANNATTLFRGSSLGTSLYAVAPLDTTPVAPGSGPQVSNILFNGVPAASNFIGGGGAAGTTTMSILPWAVGDVGLAGSGNSFVTYITPSGGAGGLRPLNFNTNLGAVEYASTITNGSISPENVRITTPDLDLNLTGPVVSTTINSLILAGATTVKTTGGSANLSVASGALLVMSVSTINDSVTINNGAQETIIHAINGAVLTVNGKLSGTGGLTKGGAGTLVLAPNSPVTNDYSGRTTITNGTISFSATPSAGADVFGAFNAASNNIVFAGPFAGPTLSYTGAVDGVFARNINFAVGSGTLNVSTTDVNLNFTGVLSGSGTLIKSGAGTAILSNVANTYTGATRLDGGILRFGTEANLGNGGDVIFNGGNIQLAGNWTTSRNIYFNSGAVWDLNGNNATINGNVAGVSSGTLTVNSPSQAVLTLAGHNTSNLAYTFGDNVTARVTSSTGLGLANATQAVTVNGGTLELSNDLFLGLKPINLNGIGVGGAGALNSSSGTNSIQGTVTVASNASLQVAAGTLNLYGNLAGSAGLIKTGSGVLNLANPAGNGFTGTLDINGGFVRANNTTGNATGSGVVSVNSGGTLTGTGSVAAIALSNGGTIAPGNGPGTLNVTSATAALAFGTGTGKVAFEINNATGTAGLNWDVLRATNNAGSPIVLPGTGGMTINIILASLNAGNVAGALPNFDNNQPYTWTFLQSSGGFTNFGTTAFTVDSTAFTSFNPNVGLFTVVNVNSGLELAVRYTPVPEPASVLLIGSAAAGLLGWYRRRRTTAAI